MAVKEALARVLAEYSAASLQPFADHALAWFIRRDLCEQVAQASGNNGRLTFKGSAGQGNWARGPWIAAFDPLVTSSAQSGYYVCYLFCEDMSGVYLSLNQGVTEARTQYKADAKTALRARATNFRALLGAGVDRFPAQTIDLKPDTPQNDTAFYEAGNVCALFYARNCVADDPQLTADFRSMLILYETLVRAETNTQASNQVDDELPPGHSIEDATRFRMHKRIERNPTLVKAVKRLRGYVCEVCKADFSKTYGPLGTGYIEAHHLKPIASLVGTKVPMDPKTDFAVLCSNCHRMIHRSGLVENVEEFKREHYRG